MGSDVFSHSFLDQASLWPKEAFSQPTDCNLSVMDDVSDGDLSAPLSSLGNQAVETASANEIQKSPHMEGYTLSSSNPDQTTSLGQQQLLSMKRFSVGSIPRRETAALPPEDKFWELLSIFFERFHPLLPCLHHSSFVQRLTYSPDLGNASALIWAILAVASKSHSDPSIQACSMTWLVMARQMFDHGIKTLAAPQENLQAAVWILFQTLGTAEIPEVWTFLGKACRFAALLGLDRIDSPRAPSPYVTQPRDSLEKEERRKTMWALFYLDKALSCLCGWALAMNDWQFMVNFPVDDDLFQQSSPEVSQLRYRGSSVPRCCTDEHLSLICHKLASVRLMNIRPYI